MTIFDRYILRRFLHVFSILFVSAFGLFIVIDGFTNMETFQDQAEDTADLMRILGSYYALQSSLFFDMAGPTLAVISAMVVLTMLVRHSEIQPVLAAGVPVFRLLVPLVAGTVIVNLGLSANQEFVIPRIAHEIQAGKRQDRTGHQIEPAYDNESHIHISGAEVFPSEARIRAAEITLPMPDIADEMVSVKAPEAHYTKKTGSRPAGWLLKGAAPEFAALPLTEGGRRRVLPAEDPADVFVATEIDANMLYNRTENYRYVSTPELVRRIRNPAFHTDTVRSQMMNLHFRLIKPLQCVIGVLITVPLILMKESRNIVGNVALCAVVLGGLFVVAQGFEYLGGANLISTHLAAWGVVIFHGTVGAWLFGLVQT